jgi:hypothetical protein
MIHVPHHRFIYEFDQRPANPESIVTVNPMPRPKPAPKQITELILELIPIHVQTLLFKYFEETPLSFLMPDTLHPAITWFVQEKEREAFEKYLNELIDTG